MNATSSPFAAALSGDEQQAVSSLLSFLPSPAYISLSIMFGLVGFVAYRFGKKMGRNITLWLGVALMFYPYLIGSSVLLLVIVGAGLCGALYYYRGE